MSFSTILQIAATADQLQNQHTGNQDGCQRQQARVAFVVSSPDEAGSLTGTEGEESLATRIYGSQAIEQRLLALDPDAPRGHGGGSAIAVRIGPRDRAIRVGGAEGSAIAVRSSRSKLP